MKPPAHALLPAITLTALAGCSSVAAPPAPVQEGPCQIAEGSGPPDFLPRITCRRDFDTLASVPLDTSIPGARSVKVVLDQLDRDALYFQNSQKYQIHYQFAAAHLSGAGRPVVTSLSSFNASEYYAPDRRFLLGAVTYYEQPAVWALEIAPYDTATPAMVSKLFRVVEAAGYFGPGLTFHPTSEAVAAQSSNLPAGIRIKTSEQLFAAIDYQPLNLATAVGRLRFLEASALESTYVSYREIVVLDNVPNDISVVMGIITEEFQTPLSHVNVLSQNRKTPNMGLRGAMTDRRLRPLEGSWVRLVVGATSWRIEAVSSAEAESHWEAHRPRPITLPPVDRRVKDLRNVEDVVVEGDLPLREAIRAAVPAFGGKAAHYSILFKTPGTPVRKAFVVPAGYYLDFMEQNGLFQRVDALLADREFQEKPEVRDARLKELRKAMENAPVDSAFQDLLRTKMAADYPGLTLRFRTSTNSEDLEGFPCAGCYESHTGDPADWADVLEAVRETWASIWLFRTFEERAYAGIDHKSVAMALLVHHNFPDEEANGVALTANPYDGTGLQPGFYVNVQTGGEAEVVHPPPGVTSDQFIYQFGQPGQPISYLSHSNLVAAGTTVLTPTQIHELGQALDAVHRRFSTAYGPAAGNNGWYAMDVEFKFDGGPGETPRAFLKQARPHPGRGR